MNARADGVENFQAVAVFLAWPAGVVFDQRRHVATAESVFGQVVSGMEVVDAIAPGDIVRRVRVWNGQ